MEELKIIEAKNPGFTSYLKKVYQYRKLILTLAIRDLKVRYAQTMLGILWSALQPLTGLLIFTIFFTFLIEIDTGDISYPLFAFSGMISWYFFSFLIVSAGTSLRDAQDLITKIYFPKLILPLSKVAVGLVEFMISLGLMVTMLIILGYLPSVNILILPVFILLNIIAGLSIAIWLSALTIRYRDFHHIIPYFINFGIWLTPVFYPSTLIPEKYSFFIYLNPMAGVIAGFRWSILGGDIPSILYLSSLPLVLLLFLGGLFYFRKIESRIVDVI